MNITNLHRQLDLAVAKMSDPSPETRVSPEKRAKLGELAEQFESIFLDTVFKAMRKSVPKSDLLTGGNAEEIFRGMLDSEYAKNLAQQRHTGIAEMIEKDMLKSMGKRISTAGESEGHRVYEEQGLRFDTKKATMLQGKSTLDR